MSVPTLKVLGALTTDPTAAPTYADLSTRAAKLHVRRGRESILESHDAGEFDVTLANTDRVLDPNNTAGAYYGNLLPERRIKLQASIGGTDYDLIHGYAAGWVQRWEQSGKVGWVDLEGHDGFKVLAGGKGLRSVWEQEIRSRSPRTWLRHGERDGLVAQDASGLGHHATWSKEPRGAEGLVSGDSDGAIDYAADNGFYLLGPYESVNPVPPITVLLLVNLRVLPAGGKWDVLFCWSNGTGQAILGNTAAQTVLVELGADGVISVLSGFNENIAAIDALKSNIALTTDTTYLVTYTRGASAPGALYVDAVDVTSLTSISFGGDAEHRGLRIGGQFFYTAMVSADGVVDEVVVLDTQLSAGDVDDLSAAAHAPWEGDTTGTRIGRLLDLAEWRSADRDLDTGQTTMPAAEIQGSGLLEQAQKAELAEAGRFFMSRDGLARHVQRHAQWTETVYATSQITFTDAAAPGAGEIGYVEVEVAPEDWLLASGVRVGRRGGSVVEVEDATARTHYFQRTIDETDLEVASDLEIADRAHWRLQRHTAPIQHIRRLRLVLSTTAQWQSVLAADLGYRVTVKRFADSASTIVEEAHIEAIEHTAEPGDGNWVVELELSPADTTDYWILGTSELGTDTRLGY